MLIFLDVETTGTTLEDKICSIALLDEESYVYELINEGKKIPPLASSIHHITNEMIHDAPKLEDSEAWGFLRKHNATQNTLVGHNISFELDMLGAKGFVWQGSIVDTMRVCKHLLSKSDSFALQVLRYELKLYKQESALLQKYGIKDALIAHSALGDVLVTELLFQTLSELASLDEMVSLSSKRALLSKFSFGKYKDRYIEEIAMHDRAYLEWMCRLEDLDEDLRYSLEYYLQG